MKGHDLCRECWSAALAAAEANALAWGARAARRPAGICWRDDDALGHAEELK